MNNNISEDFSYKSKLNKSSISEYQKALKYYFENFNNASLLKNDIPIFLDTNVLLHYYKISFKARGKLEGFFKKNAHRLYLTEQVQREFIRNREERINEFHMSMTETLPNNFSKNVINQIQSFLDKNKTILIDYPFLEKNLLKIKKGCEKDYERLQEEINSKKVDIDSSKFADGLLDVYSLFQYIDELNPEELKLIKEDFNSLRKSIVDEQKIKTLLDKPMNAFPGMGDILQKKDDPYGDFIIYHEILKFIRKEKKNAVFLTFDSTKGDWLTKDKKAHLHYVDNIFANTNHAIFILDAKRTFEELLDISFKSVISSEDNYNEIDFFSQEQMSQIIFEWSIIENFVREYVDRLDLAPMKARIFDIFKVVWRKNIISGKELAELARLSKIRSAISHGDYDAFLKLSEVEKSDIYSQLQKFMDRFKNLNDQFIVEDD